MALKIGGWLWMLMKKDDRIIRVLETKDDQRLIIHCSQKSMPVRILEQELSGYVPCTDEELGSELPCFEDLTPQQQRYAHERYTLIAGVIPFLGDKKFRSEAISCIAKARNISKQTIRHYLQRYLVYQNIAALAPPPKKAER